MTLHIFNPEHDIALASGLSNFTAPHAGRRLRFDLGFLPALWAEDGDAVLVDDVERAVRSAARRPVGTRRFVSRHQVASLPVSRIEPWGWNAALRAQLLRAGLGEALMPTEAEIERIRQLSHRRTALRLLPLLRAEGTVGEAFECRTAEEVGDLLLRYDQVVLKAPWSSSGRGLRYLSADRHPLSGVAGWLRNLLASQGSVMVEPQYRKVMDFGMEFHIDGEGRAVYDGLSLFHTQNGAYTGNLLATERAKNDLLTRHIDAALLDEVQQRLIRELPALLDGYHGPLGIDMMVVKPLTSHFSLNTTLLHPCVELNLRRTMGHVALALSTMDDDDVRRVMRIAYDGNNYKLLIRKL